CRCSRPRWSASRCCTSRTWSGTRKSVLMRIPKKVSRRSPTSRADVTPLVTRFPALARVPRVALGSYPTPVLALRKISPSLWIKRDDLCAEPMGGNKARALEFLLGDLRPGQQVVTVGSAGSTHALAVAVYATRLGTGGTAAGLALAFRIARREIEVVGARVVPRIVGRKRRVLGLAHRTAGLIEHITGESIPRVRRRDITIAHGAYGGAYGRETEAA